MSQRNQKRRVKECPNPIFEKWIVEWRDDAVAKNSKMQYVYSKALASLRRYPLLLKNGRECEMLEYFGPSISSKIDQRMKLEHHLFPEGFDDVTILEPLPKKPKKKKGNNDVNFGEEPDPDDVNERPKKPKGKGAKEYIPAFRSGAYALLVTLFLKEETPNYRGYMLKSELQQEAQEHCESSMTTATHGNYTSWNSMATLASKGLILKQGNPVKFMLTIEGRELAGKLLNADKDKQNPGSSTQTDSDNDDEDIQVVVPSISRVKFQSGEFEILLCVDTSETTAKYRKEEVLGELRKNGVPLEVTRLNLGDFVWICRKNQATSSTSNRNRLTISRSTDIILPFVVERKRSDDLSSSIKDGRFHEQKLRLEESGLQPIYLIESYGSGDFGLADGALSQAIANTQITNRFIIHETESIKDTCAYLTHMTRHLKKIYQAKSVCSCTKEEWPLYKTKTDTTYLMTFCDFNEFGTKTRNWTVAEMFARHLMKIRGVSADKAFAIMEKYPTLLDLVRAYRKCETTKEAETLLASIRFGSGTRTVGQAISRTIHLLYTSSIFT